MADSIQTTAPASTGTVILYNQEIELGAIALVLQHPDLWGEFHLIGRTDFSPVYRPLWEIISQQLDSTPPASVAALVLSQKLDALSIKVGGFAPYEVLNGLLTRFTVKTDAPALAKELKRLSVRRFLIAKLDEARKELVGKPTATFEEMTALVERNLSAITTAYHKPETYEVLGEAVIKAVEDRADNPINPDEQLYMGPIPSINRTVGPLIFPGSFTTIIARTGVGKTSFGFYYCVNVAERYGLPLLWLDVAEMTLEQLQMRAVCCLSNGEVPLWAVRSGEWRKNPKMLKIVREDLWPRVRKIQMVYKNVGGMSPREKTTFIRRHSYSKVGRGRFFIICEDYLKGVEALKKDTQEYQALGYYVGDIKTLVTDELNAGYWSSLQGNRKIITSGKKANEINDSGEEGASISDRIIQQATNGFLMRFKVPEELQAENNLFGNMVLKRAKLREGYGRDYREIAKPVKMPNGQWIDNYWHINSHDFHFADKGLHSDAVKTLGLGKVDVKDGDGPKGGL